MVAGGLPGVLIGSAILSNLNVPSRQGILYAALGCTIVLMAAINLYRLWVRPTHKPIQDRSRWLPLITLPIGAEVGFSSAGAGAMGSLVLLAITPLTAAQAVGTDLFFGLCVSLVGAGLQLPAGNFNPAIWSKLG